MKNKLLSAGILGIGLIVSSLILTNGAFAQTAEDSIQFPVAELGDCKDKEACKVYCDDADHIDACLAFAEKNNLMSEDELATAKKFMEAGGKGPGDCTGKESCEAYCNDINHIDACIAFAEKAGILSPDKLAEAKQVQAAIAKGIKPPACNGKKECDAYCEDSSHMKECIAFGEAAGFLQGKDLEDAKKVLTAVENGATPPACKGKEACDAYCSDRTHIEACMTFAQAAGLMTPEEAQNSQKMLDAIKKGVMPPNCSGKEGCDTYCAEPAHTDECINFAIAAGFMTDKEAEMAKKTGGKGPGGCIGRDACDTFCSNQDNQQTCMDFAKENGFDVESGGPGGGSQGGGFKPTTENGGTDASIRIGNCKNLGECTAYCESHQTECQKLGVPDTQECVSGMPGYAMEQCQSYCSDHKELCDLARYNVGRSGNFQQGGQQGEQRRQQGSEGSNGPNGGQNGGPPGGGPGGCKGQEACAAYCKDHLKECQEFVPQGGAGGQMGPANQQQQGQQQPQGEQFAPGTYPNQPPPEGQQTPGTLFVPRIEQNNQTPPPGDGTSGAYQYQQTQSEPVPQAQPIEQTAPQSFNFDLNSSLAAAIASFKEFKF
ncbi:MAG: hypothetical protein Q8P23_02975 [bacterium]|nr:hypothetical protein [bacterium]